MKKYSQLSHSRTDLRAAIPLKMPFTLLFEPAAMCNFKCPCCYYSDPNYNMPKGMMEWEDFKKIVWNLEVWEHWAEEKVKVIRLIGFGEPLLNRNIGDMVCYLKDLDVADRLEITTNGSLLTPPMCIQLINCELDYLRVSIYNDTPNKMKKKIVNNIAELKALRGSREKPFIYVKTLEADPKFFETFMPIADEVAIEKTHNWLEGVGGDSICPQPFKMMSIRFNGDVIVCDPDWKNNTKVGNALEENIEDIWNGEKMKTFQTMQLEHRRQENESCRNCSFVDNEFYVKDKL